MLKFNYEKIMKPKTVVHCTTEEQAKLLLRWADSKGLTWCDGKSYLENNHWDICKESSCYNLYLGGIANKKWYSNQRFIICRFENVVLNNNIFKNKKRKVKCLNKNVETENKEEKHLEYVIKRLKENEKLTLNIYNLIKTFEGE